MTAAPLMSPLHQPVPVAATQGTLALDLAPLLDPPRLRGTTSIGADVVSIDTILRRQLEGWSLRYAQAVVEVVAGDRPIAQVARWTSVEVYADLARRAQLVARAGLHQPGLGRGWRPAVRPFVRSARTSFVSPGVAEVAIHLRYGERSRALAARFEHRQTRWVCTALEFA